MLARVHIQQRTGTYWLFHKNLVDETLDQVLDRKPEERLWLVVAGNKSKEFDFPAQMLNKHDLFKVGRVRFKVREVVSTYYKVENEQNQYISDQYRRMYPMKDPSILVEDEALDQTFRSPTLSGAVLSQQQDDLGYNPQLIPGYTQNDLQAVTNPALEGTGGFGGQLSPNLDPNINNNTVSHRQTILPTLQHAAMSDPISEGSNQLHNLNSTKLHKDKSEVPICRICLTEEEDSIEDPLLTPCKCSGSMSHIHYLCLKNWFKLKRIVRPNMFVNTFYWSGLECELCKQQYPYEIQTADGTLLNIIEYETPHNRPGHEQQFIVLESISTSVNKVIHVVNMERAQNFFIGRGQEAEVRVTDISVSRLHASIFKSPQGKFYLCDNNSKFGTLIEVKSPVRIEPDQKLNVQVGRSILIFQLQRNLMHKMCACLSPKPKTKPDQLSLDDMVSINGLDFFPSEFCTQAFLQQRQRRASLQLKKLNSTGGSKAATSKSQKNKEEEKSSALYAQIIQLQQGLSQMRPATGMNNLDQPVPEEILEHSSRSEAQFRQVADESSQNLMGLRGASRQRPEDLSPGIASREDQESFSEASNFSRQQSEREQDSIILQQRVESSHQSRRPTHQFNPNQVIHGINELIQEANEAVVDPNESQASELQTQQRIIRLAPMDVLRSQQESDNNSPPRQPLARDSPSRNNSPLVLLEQPSTEPPPAHQTIQVRPAKSIGLGQESPEEQQTPFSQTEQFQSPIIQPQLNRLLAPTEMD